MEETDKAVLAGWSVWRQDDNGNRYIVRSNLGKVEAHELVKQYEAGGHKQTYWIEKPKKKII